MLLVVFSFIFGAITRATKRNKPLLIFNFAALLLIIILIKLLVNSGIVPLIMFLMLIQIVLVAPSLGIAMELAANITFPISKPLFTYRLRSECGTSSCG